jgi:hydroxymethylbilane synthase
MALRFAMGRMAGDVCQGGSCQFQFTCAMSVGMIKNLPNPAQPLRIGTRGSPLALWQAHEVRRYLMAAFSLPDDAFAIVVIKVMGDQIQDRALKDIGGKGLFTREIEDALIDGGIDIAVHSMKDMPTLQPDGLILDCYLPREDVRDAFVSPGVARLADLPIGALVGSSSLRRRAQLALRRPDLKLVEFRGNVQTRMRKLEQGVAVATFLAMAGLNRLGMAHMARGPIEVDEMLPAVAQGAIGIERRVSDARVEALLTGIHHGPTGDRLAAERAFLLKLDGSCQTPIAGLAVIEGDQIWLRGEILRPDGTASIPGEIRGPVADGVALGTDLAARLLAQAPTDFFELQ